MGGLERGVDGRRGAHEAVRVAGEQGRAVDRRERSGQIDAGSGDQVEKSPLLCHFR
jgi:hypothetical protein